MQPGEVRHRQGVVNSTVYALPRRQGNQGPGASREKSKVSERSGSIDPMDGLQSLVREDWGDVPQDEGF